MKLYLLILMSMLLVCGCQDDDLYPIEEKPLLLSYESVSGNMQLSAEYEYDSEKRITQISWQRATPGITQGVDVFVYDSDGRLKEQVRSITGLVDEKTKYTWVDETILASMIYINNKKMGFSFYDYNGDDQLERVEIYRREGDVGFLRTDSIGFTYHPDGNLFKMLKYVGDPNTGIMSLLSVQTFPHYLSLPNPVATVEILPIVNLQRTLPKEYTVSDMDNNSLSYTMQYDLRTDGYPKERTVTSSGNSERTVYKYDQ